MEKLSLFSIAMQAVMLVCFLVLSLALRRQGAKSPEGLTRGDRRVQKMCLGGIFGLSFGIVSSILRACPGMLPVDEESRTWVLIALTGLSYAGFFYLACIYVVGLREKEL